ncbi:hypothetical protein KGQ20_10425 [Catenulispora sp. NF23]|uniref:hypothetical protein n=1 Tax=Catenulispora pinistramenti TaxID=2705254 RepID=UPI001BAB7D8F|nr:hypothetical protein [Catenulispora pinistramenti]MBS2533190.1 hypothetical protein [Catenulispora pinistramenti]
MTENPNTPPDPNAGQPPGGPIGQPSTPAQPTPSQTPAAQSATDSAKSEAAGSGAAKSGAAQAETAKSEAVSAAKSATEPGESGGSAQPGSVQPGSVQPGAESPVTQNPATGGLSENPWVEPTEEEAGFAEPVDPNAPNTGVAATFLPGIDAAAVLALVVAALAAGAYLLVNPLVQAHDAARTWSDFKNNVPRTKQDPFGVQRDWVSYQSWAHIILGLVAVLLALLVLGLWTARKNKLRSRSFAQAALVLGLAVVLYGILLKTGAVGSEIPSMKAITSGLSSSQ